MDDKHTVRCAVYAIFVRDHHILLLERKNTGWMDGYYSLPAGHLERDETMKDAMIREIREETGVEASPTNLTFYHLMHRTKAATSDYEYIDIYFKVEYWQGEPVNHEPEKAAGVKWFDLDALPEHIIPSVKTAIEYYKSKIIFSELE